ncbi:hypothetical protein SETIT_7G243700v2 [Setaria italica]|uniref:Uncharacterized protein n=1 Tax=Setaria italica TaxID=4555 RepID=A0A368RZB4_SETIT|nr:hypothetical protein SETIT_7G243700v2 [Setaria italica]
MLGIWIKVFGRHPRTSLFGMESPPSSSDRASSSTISNVIRLLVTFDGSSVEVWSFCFRLIADVQIRSSGAKVQGKFGGRMRRSWAPSQPRIQDSFEIAQTKVQKERVTFTT